MVEIREPYLLVPFLLSDGGISITKSKTKYPYLIRKIFVDSKHPAIRKGLNNLLSIFGFSPKIYGNQIRLTKKRDIIAFKKIIGFLDGVYIGKDSKRFCGILKNDLVDEVIASYDDPIYFMSRI